MKRRSSFLLAITLAFLVALVCWQQAPGHKLTPAEIDDYLGRIDRQIQMPADEKAAALKRIRAFAEADDGAPVYMLNVMRMYDKIRPLAGMAGFSGTPAQANAYYEERAIPLLLKGANYPIFGGQVREPNLFGYGEGRDGWSRVLVVRYTGRRAFLELIADPAYGPIAPYKLMSLDLLLTPSKLELAVPDLRLVAATLALVLFLALGWWRAVRRAA